MVTTKGAASALMAALVSLVMLIASAGETFAQLGNVGTPFNNIGDKFFEQSGVGFSMRGSGWFFENNVGMPIPPFGGFDPNAGATFGFGFCGGDVSGQLGFSLGSGSSRTLSSNSPSVMMMGNGFGMIQETTWSPFITEIIPIVGDRAPASPLAQSIAQFRAQGGIGQIPMRPIQPLAPRGQSDGQSTAKAHRSSAERGALSVAEIKRQQAAEEEATAEPIKALLDEAKQQASSQNWKEARKAYYAALEIAPEYRKKEIRELIRAMERSRRGEKP